MRARQQTSNLLATSRGSSAHEENSNIDAPQPAHRSTHDEKSNTKLNVCLLQLLAMCWRTSLRLSIFFAEAWLQYVSPLSLESLKFPCSFALQYKKPLRSIDACRWPDNNVTICIDKRWSPSIVHYTWWCRWKCAAFPPLPCEASIHPLLVGGTRSGNRLVELWA